MSEEKRALVEEVVSQMLSSGRDISAPGINREEMLEVLRHPKAVKTIYETIWPPFRSEAPTINAIYDEFKADVDFYVIYIKEIHPEDGWQVKQNEREGVVLRQHLSIEERVDVGKTCMLRLDLKLPGLVDEMDDGVAKAWNAVPERLYLVGRDGKVAYKGGLGPMDFKPKQWREAIAAYLAA